MSAIDEIQVLKSAPEVEEHISTVQSFADRFRDSLGFLPASAYAELAKRGNLWVAINKSSKQAIAHLIFGGRYPNIKITQLLVYPDHRLSGVGHLLIDKLIAYGEENHFLVISARVAADLKANNFWQKCGLTLIRQETGGASRNRVINIRALELNTPSLFSTLTKQQLQNPAHNNIYFIKRPIITTPTYCIDLNVFFDVAKKRIRQDESMAVIRAGLNNQIRLCITDEFIRELQRSSSNSADDPILNFSLSLPRLPKIDETELSQLVSELRILIFPNKDKRTVNDNSDLTHLASCIHHKVYGFLTSEKALLSQSKEIKDSYGITIESPASLYGPESPETKDNNALSTIQEKEIEVSDLLEPKRVGIEKFLTMIGVEQSDITTALMASTSGRERRRKIIYVDKSVMGVAAWETPNSYSKEFDLHFYINEEEDSSQQIISHILSLASRDIPPKTPKRINLRIGPNQEKTREIALKFGFVSDLGESKTSNIRVMSKVSYSGPIQENNWGEFKKAFHEITGLEISAKLPTYDEFTNTGLSLSTQSGEQAFPKLFEFETLISPATILCQNRDAIIIPIQKQYANDLLATPKKQLDLLPRHEALLHVEKAYFKKPNRTKLFDVGTPIIFYVSGKDGGPKEAVGCARITYSDLITPEEAILNLQPQGVLPINELEKLINRNGQLHAFCFDNYNSFPNKIHYDKLKAMKCISNANLVTAEPLSNAKLKELLTLAYK